MSEPRSPRPYSLAGHVYAGHGLDTLAPNDLDDLAGLLVIAERIAARPMAMGNPDRLLAACVAAERDPFAQWRHELTVDESLREMVALLLPPEMVACQRVAHDRLLRAQQRPDQ